MLTQSFVNVVLLNRRSGGDETHSGSASTRGNITVPIEREFAPGDRVKNTKTGETGTVSSASPKDIGTTPVIYDKEFDNWGTIWDTPNYRLELLP